MNFLLTRNRLATEYREAGWSGEDADRLGSGQTLIAKTQNATSVEELREVMVDMIRDLYRLGHPVPPMGDQAKHR